MRRWGDRTSRRNGLTAPLWMPLATPDANALARTHSSKPHRFPLPCRNCPWGVDWAWGEHTVMSLPVYLCPFPPPALASAIGGGMMINNASDLDALADVRSNLRAWFDSHYFSLGAEAYSDHVCLGAHPCVCVCVSDCLIEGC